MTILEKIKTSKKPAVVCQTQTISYDELRERMSADDRTLPLPLLGNSWQDNFCLYTTGTTGQRKGVIISQEAVIANTENLIKAQGYHEDLVFIIAGDMTHLGCWSKIFPVLFTGGTLVILPDQMKSLSTFFEVISDDSRRYATFLVPSNIRMLLDMAPEQLRQVGSRFEFIETGGAPMSQVDMERLCQLLPSTRLYNTYALTEAGIVATHNYNLKGECIAGCVGLPIRPGTISITSSGHIAVQGPTLMSGYLPLEPPLNPLERAKRMEPPLNHHITTSDLGKLDAQGRLHILGRADNIINVGGYKVNPEEVEEAAHLHPMVHDCICVPVPHKLLGHQLQLNVVLSPGATLDKKLLAQHLAAHLERYKVPMLYQAVLYVPRNQNGKIIR